MPWICVSLVTMVSYGHDKRRFPVIKAEGLQLFVPTGSWVTIGNTNICTFHNINSAQEGFNAWIKRDTRPTLRWKQQSQFASNQHMLTHSAPTEIVDNVQTAFPKSLLWKRCYVLFWLKLHSISFIRAKSTVNHYWQNSRKVIAWTNNNPTTNACMRHQEPINAC